MPKVIVFPVINKYDWRYYGPKFQRNYFLMDHYLADRRADVVQPAFLALFVPMAHEQHQGSNFEALPVCLFGDPPKAALLLHFSTENVEAEPGFNCVVVDINVDDILRYGLQFSSINLDASLFPGVSGSAIQCYRPYSALYIPYSGEDSIYRNHLVSLLLAFVPGYTGRTMLLGEYLNSSFPEDSLRYGIRALIYGH